MPIDIVKKSENLVGGREREGLARLRVSQRKGAQERAPRHLDPKPPLLVAEALRRIEMTKLVPVDPFADAPGFGTVSLLQRLEEVVPGERDDEVIELRRRVDVRQDDLQANSK
jgi:hypothetical protein